VLKVGTVLLQCLTSKCSHLKLLMAYLEGVLHLKDGRKEERLRYAMVTLSRAPFPIKDDHMPTISTGSTAKAMTSSINSMSVSSSSDPLLEPIRLLIINRNPRSLI